MTSYIYFIQAQGDGPIKIGTTQYNPLRRMVKIQSDCPWPVSLIGTIEGTVSQEKQIHLVLSRYRTQGEWFEPHPVVLAAISEAIKVGRSTHFEKSQVDETEITHPLKKWRVSRALTQTEAGDLLDTDKMSISRWECGVRLPHRTKWSKIQSITGITAADLALHMMESVQ